MAKLQEVMTKDLVTVPVGESLSKAYRIMAENQIRHLPVIGKDDLIVGVLSSKDFPPFGELRDGRVEYYMSAPVQYIKESAPLKDAVYSILAKKISSLVVVDEDENVTGIVTTDDLLWYLVVRLEKDTVEKKSLFSRLFDKDTVGKIANQISLTGI